MSDKPRTDHQKVSTSIKNMMRDMIDTRIPVYDWKYSFRASSIPFCQWHVALSRMYEKYPKGRPADSTSFLFDYYVSIGTTIHTVYQRWLGRLGYLYGHFKCGSCGVLVKNSLGWPEKCPTEECFPREWEYQELKLHKEAKGDIGLVSAHCDGLLHFDWMEPDHYYLVDFKSCSLKTMPSPGTRLVEKHHMKYLTQTGFYHHILTKHMGYKIDGTVFLFVPRDSPMQSTAIIYNQEKMSEGMFNSIVEEYAMVEEAARHGNLKVLNKSCSSSADEENCPFNDVCFNKQHRVESLNELFQAVFKKPYEE